MNAPYSKIIHLRIKTLTVKVLLRTFSKIIDLVCKKCLDESVTKSLTKLDLSLWHHFKKPLIMIGTYCLIIIPTDRSIYFFSLFQRSKMKWLLSLALRNGSHDAGPFDCWICQRKGQSFPWEDLVLWPSLEIFQEFFKKFTSRCLSLQYWINYPYYILLSAQATGYLHIMVISI